MPFNLNNISYLNIISILFYLIPFSLGLGSAVPDILLSIIASSFLIFILIKKYWKILKNKFTFFFILFWIVILINSFFSENFNTSFRISFFYIRYLFFSLAVYYIICNNKNFLSNTFYSITFSLFVIFFFSFFQLITGYNIFFDNLQDLVTLGFRDRPQRISGLFGEELILGGYLVRIFPLYFALYLIQKKNFLINILFLSNFILLFIMSFYSGERSAIFLLFLILLLSYIFVKNFYKIKIYSIIFLFVISGLIFSLDKKISFRFFEQTLFHQIIQNNKIYIFSEQHQSHFLVAYRIFKDNVIFGSGVKSFSNLCHQDKYNEGIVKLLKDDGTYTYLSCTTHPHNTYFQILSETGLVGFAFLITILVYLFKRFFYLMKIKKLNVNKYNYSMLLNILFFSFLFPFIPTGNFFSNWLSVAYFMPVGFFLYSMDLSKKK
jgi:O-antigen ligase